MIRVTLKLMSGGMGHSVLNQVLVSGFNFAVGIIAARMMGVADFGLFTLIFMIAQLFVVAEGDLLTTPMMTLAGSKARLSRHYYASLFTLAVGATIVSALLMSGFVAIYFFAKGLSPPIALIGAAAFFTFAQNLQIIVRRLLFARKEFNAGVYLEVFRPLLALVLIGIWVFGAFSSSLPMLLVILGLSSLLPVVIAVAGYLDIGADLRMMRALLARHWPISSWFLLLMFVSICQEQAIWTTVGIQVGDEAVGALRSGQYLLGITHILMLSLENFLPRTAAEEFRKGDARALGLYLIRQLSIVGGTSALLIAGIAYFADEIVFLVFGADFAEFGHLVRLFAVVYMIIIIRTVFMQYLRAVEHIRMIFISFCASSAIAIASIYPFLTTYGVEGAVYCMMLTQTACLAGLALGAGMHFAKRLAASQENTDNDSAPGLPGAAVKG